MFALDFKALAADASRVRKSAVGLGWFVTLAAMAALGVWLLWRAGKCPAVADTWLAYQDADAPLGMPASGEVDERWCFPSAWQRAQIPQAARFDPPLGSEHGGFSYNAQAFWELVRLT